jgi:hypothetical protein
MRFILIASIAALASTASAFPQSKVAGGVEAQLIDREKQSWAAWQNKDVAFWQRHLSADHVEIDGPNGPQDRDYVLKGVADRTCAVAKYKIDHFTFRRLGADAGMLVYRAEQEFACGDKHFPNVGWVTSLYKRRNGGWENVLFEHLVVPPPKPAPAPKP